MKGLAEPETDLPIPGDLLHKLGGDAPSPRASAPEADTSADRATGDNYPPDRPSHYWTWRLLSAGFSPADCGAIRGLPPKVVLEHALRAADDGWRVSPEWFLGPELLAALEAIARQGPPEETSSILARLPAGTCREEVELFLRCRQTARAEGRGSREPG
jgi:hypothetical protein